MGIVTLVRAARSCPVTSFVPDRSQQAPVTAFHSTNAAAPQLPRVDRTEPLAPRPNRLGGDRHASLREAIFGSADAAAEPMGEPDRVADDVGRESIAVIAGRWAPHRPILPLVAST